MDGYDFVASSLGDSQRTVALERSRSENRLALQISSSYGCTCILTASSVKLLARSDVITLALCKQLPQSRHSGSLGAAVTGKQSFGRTGALPGYGNYSRGKWTIPTTVQLLTFDVWCRQINWKTT